MEGIIFAATILMAVIEYYEAIEIFKKPVTAAVAIIMIAACGAFGGLIFGTPTEYTIEGFALLSFHFSEYTIISCGLFVLGVHKVYEWRFGE